MRRSSTCLLVERGLTEVDRFLDSALLCWCWLWLWEKLTWSGLLLLSWNVGGLVVPDDIVFVLLLRLPVPALGYWAVMITK